MPEEAGPHPEASATPPPGFDRFTVGLVGGVLFALLGFVWLVSQIEPPTAPEVGEGATVLPDPIVLPDFSLLDQDGRSFTRSDLEGQWSLLFFGYSYCPDVCPVVLSELARVQGVLREDPEAGALPQVYFVSVDPARDTPERLREYVPFFDPAFRGLTGTPDEIAVLTRPLGVYHQAREPGERGDYLVDHSSKLWLIDPRGRYRALLDDPHDPRPFLELLGRIRALGVSG